eukprot:9472982-Pyramimonas_sp.AAC.1
MFSESSRLTARSGSTAAWTLSAPSHVGSAEKAKRTLPDYPHGGVRPAEARGEVRSAGAGAHSSTDLVAADPPSPAGGQGLNRGSVSVARSGRCMSHSIVGEKQGLLRMYRLLHLLRCQLRQLRLSLQLELLPPRAAPGSGRARKPEIGRVT